MKIKEAHGFIGTLHVLLPFCSHRSKIWELPGHLWSLLAHWHSRTCSSPCYAANSFRGSEYGKVSALCCALQTAFITIFLTHKRTIRTEILQLRSERCPPATIPFAAQKIKRVMRKAPSYFSKYRTTSRVIHKSLANAASLWRLAAQRQ